MKLRTAIEQHLCESGLQSNVVAASAGVSVRYANDVLADEGTSVARLILATRLHRCRLALEDPQQTKRTVSEVAQAWGFSDMTHFARRYRETYGVLPSKVRKAARENQLVPVKRRQDR
jgi:AraC-like DNA-binding protein